MQNAQLKAKSDQSQHPSLVRGDVGKADREEYAV